jgi:hypothetical protein
VKIVVGCIIAAIAYGIVHDEITSRVCVEYFTVFHPPVFHTQSPTLLGIGWGLVATWWVGLILGTLVALAARAGPYPTATFDQIVPLLVRVLIGMACCAVIFGVLGYFFGSMPAAFAQMIPTDLDRRFLADWWAHNASYASGLLGGLTACAIILLRRTSRSIG